MLARMPSGDWGIYWTLNMMRSIARTASRDPSVRRTAVKISHGLFSPHEDIAAIWRFLAEHVLFVRDPVLAQEEAAKQGVSPEQIEYVQQPAKMIQEIDVHGMARGDCDDVATLGAALALAFGLHASFVVVSFKQGPVRPYTHVYVEVAVDSNGPWVPLDTTRPPSWDQEPTRRETRPV